MRNNGKLMRKIVEIDEEKCDGCGDCVTSCAEGAIQLVDGKARLVSDVYCDGLGVCLGHCPQGAITIEERESAPFDEAAVARHLASQGAPAPAADASPALSLAPAHGSGCPGSKALDLRAPGRMPAPIQAGTAGQAVPAAPGASPQGALRHWPIMLHLLPPEAPFLQGAELILCAPCVPAAMPDFHERLLSGRSVALACPKLDDQTGYLEKLAAMLQRAGVTGLTVARMMVPCCGGLLQLAHQARELAGTSHTITDVVVGHDGCVLQVNEDAHTPSPARRHGIG